MRVAIAMAALVAGAHGGAVRAETHAAVPPGGGLPALDVKVDLLAGAVETGGAKIAIPLNRAQLPSESQLVVEPIAIGRDRHVVHVRVPAKNDPGGLAWEAILVPGKANPLFAGLTGLTGGDPGERVGKAIQIVSDDEMSFVLVGDLHEDLRICGQTATLIDPLAVYPESLDLRPATVQRLSPEQQASAQKLVATAKGQDAAPPLAKLLVARGSSVKGSMGAELTDGDLRTVWKEKRPGVGQGEFVVMAAPRDVPIARMRVVVAPTGAAPAGGAAPKTFYLVTSTETFEVTLPEDAWLKPGQGYEIAFPHPVEAACITLVLDSGFARGQQHPEVGIAELYAYSEFDAPGATLEEVAKKLSSERGIAAAQVLERAGAAALGAVEKAYDDLDARGRALAIDVAAAHEQCEEAAPLLARALCTKSGQAPRKAREKLERCAGSAPVLAKSLRETAETRACVAPVLAGIAPQEALEPIADVMAATPEADGETRAALRGAFGDALKASAQGKLAALLGDTHRPPAARLEIMRAAQERVTEAPVEGAATVDELLRGSPPMRTRYLVLGPLEQLARSGDKAAVARLVNAMAHDPEWPVRARAAEGGSTLADAQAALLDAARDPEPRVREAALQSLAAQPSPRAVQVAKALLRSDGWSFVRAQAVGVLAKAPPAGDVDKSLGAALHDPSVGVRGAALVALARHRATDYRSEIRDRLDDKDEDVEVRTLAAQALGGVCDAGSADRLTELARVLGTPGTSEDDQQLALAAVVGLAALHPADLPKRLAPLLAPASPPHVRAAAQQALSARSACR